MDPTILFSVRSITSFKIINNYWGRRAFGYVCEYHNTDLFKKMMRKWLNSEAVFVCRLNEMISGVLILSSHLKMVHWGFLSSSKDWQKQDYSVNMVCEAAGFPLLMRRVMDKTKGNSSSFTYTCLHTHLTTHPPTHTHSHGEFIPLTTLSLFGCLNKPMNQYNYPPLCPNYNRWIVYDKISRWCFWRILENIFSFHCRDASIYRCYFHHNDHFTSPAFWQCLDVNVWHI